MVSIEGFSQMHTGNSLTTIERAAMIRILRGEPLGLAPMAARNFRRKLRSICVTVEGQRSFHLCTEMVDALLMLEQRTGVRVGALVAEAVERYLTETQVCPRDKKE
jgi:hypothetical protein